MRDRPSPPSAAAEGGAPPAPAGIGDPRVALPDPISRRALLGHGAAAAAFLALPSLRPVGRGGIAPAPPLPPPAATPYLETARKAERWIARSAVREAGGVTWPADPADAKSVQANLYSGSPGVVLFYLELAHATGESRWLDTARDGALSLASGLPGTASSLGEEGHGLYTGVAGIAYVLELARRATGDARLGAGRDRAVALLRESLAPVSAGAAWNPSNDIISGSAGILLTLAWLDRNGGAWDGWRRDAARVGDRLMEVAIPEFGGVKWGISARVPRRYPNFSHGTAGVAYTLATLSRETGEHRFLDAALAGERYLEAIATRTTNDGVRVYHSEPGGEDLFYLSWCHGPAGTARLYHRLAEATGDATWRATVPRLAQAIIDSGVPEVHPDRSGYWNNISQCCGSCGVVEFFIAMHAMTGEARHLTFARRVMDDAVHRATADGDGLKWIQNEHRVRPDLLVAQTGLMQGSAGVGLALLHLDGALTGRAPRVVLPDAPAWV
ncbi:MAG TPA: lanthionine synthetase LanC family protein [Gemmatimonadaceae bacterium]|nr:lanthionine synthetase LanC family protein [Gemmatimonadaceae bacterium]